MAQSPKFKEHAHQAVSNAYLRRGAVRKPSADQVVADAVLAFHQANPHLVRGNGA